MNRFLALAPALLFALPALAQDAPAAPEDGYQNLWCHLAFVTTSTQLPVIPEADLQAAIAAGTSATPEQLQVLALQAQIQMVLDGVSVLLDQATASYTEAGYTTEQFEAAKTDLTSKVAEQVNGGGAEAEFSFDECATLLPTPDTAAAPAQ